MGVVIECLMLFAALLTDFLLGNYGFMPCLAMFVLFHASQCVSLRFATVAALVVGTLIDLVYCRASLWTPLWYILALYAGQAAIFRREDEDTGHFLRIVFAGAAVGGVLSLRRVVIAWGSVEWGVVGMACDIVAGAAIGVLKLFLVVMIGDLICSYLGVREFFPRGRKASYSSSGGGRRRFRRVRAEKVAGKRS